MRQQCLIENLLKFFRSTEPEKLSPDSSDAANALSVDLLKVSDPTFDDLPTELHDAINAQSAILTVRFIPNAMYSNEKLPRTLEVPMEHRLVDAKPVLPVDVRLLYLRGLPDRWQASPVVKSAAFKYSGPDESGDYYTTARRIKTTRLIVRNNTPWNVDKMEISMEEESPTYMHVTKSNWDSLEGVGTSTVKTLTCAQADTYDIFQIPSPIQNVWNAAYNLHIRLILTDSGDATYTDDFQRTAIAAVYASER